MWKVPGIWVVVWSTRISIDGKTCFCSPRGRDLLAAEEPHLAVQMARPMCVDHISGVVYDSPSGRNVLTVRECIPLFHGGVALPTAGANRATPNRVWVMQGQPTSRVELAYAGETPIQWPPAAVCKDSKVQTQIK